MVVCECVRILKGWLLSLQGGGGGHAAVDGLCCCLIDRDRRKEKGTKRSNTNRDNG